MKIAQKDIGRFLRYQNVGASDSCWEWSGTRMKGYGYFKMDYKMFRAHRLSWHLKHGDINSGLTIDHLCKNKGCQNVGHMEQVTYGVNNARSDKTASTVNRHKTHCIRGHAFDDENTYIYWAAPNAYGKQEKIRHRACKQCKREHVRRRYHEKRNKRT